MDRGMKLMFGMMTAAICLMAINMFGNSTSQAYAANVVDRGGSEPTIVSFRIVSNQRTNHAESHDVGYRMWSDGAVECNFLGRFDPSTSNSYDQGTPGGSMPDGWFLITDSVAGYACAGDTDGNRMIDVDDLVAVITEWGACEEDPPGNLPPDLDLF